MKILLIIPAYNEAESIEHVLSEIKQFSHYDAIVINDCSTDNTSDKVRAFGGNVIDLPVNLGLSGAVQTGFMFALKNDYDVCIQIDGDGQHIPEEIERLLIEIKNGADIVIGSRFLEKTDTYKQTFLRTLGAKHLQLMIKMFSGLRLTDPTSGMRAFKRTVYEELALATNERPEPDTILYFARKGYNIKEVQVDMRERLAGESYLTTFKAIRYMIDNTLSFFYVLTRTPKNQKRGEK